MGKKRVRKGGTIAFIVIFIIFAVLVALVGAAVFVGVYVNKINDILVAVPVFPKIADAINTHLQNNLGFSPIIGGWDSEFATGLIELFSLFGTAVILIFFLLLPLVLIAVVRRSRKNHLSARIIFLVINYFINFVALLFAVLLMLNTMLGSGFGWLTDGFNKVVALFDGPLAVIKIPHLSSAANAAAYLVFALIFIDLLFDILCTAIGKKPKMVDEDEEERQNRIETAKQNNGYSYVPSYSTSEEVLLGNITMLPLPTRSVKGLVNIAAVFDEIDSDNFRATYRDVAILNALEPIYPNPLDELPGQYQTDLYGILDDLEPLKLSPVEEDLIEADKIEKEQEEKFIVLPGVDEYDADPWAKEEVKEEDITSTAAPEKVETNLFVEEQQEQKEEVKEEVKEEYDENKHTPYTSKPTNVGDDWILPKYVPEVKEEEKVEEKQPEPEPIKEEPKQEPVKEEKPAPAPVSAVPAPANAKQRKKIVPVDPFKHEVKEEAKDEKKLAPISGPLHPIRKKAVEEEKIAPVAPKDVKFGLKKYSIKTYSGNISSEEAFRRGITKVKPTVNPVFYNKSNENEPAWKKRIRAQEVKENGYQDVKAVKDLSTVKADKKEDAKPSRPIKPIKPITPVTPVKPVEKKEVEKKPEVKPVVAPVAPIKKPANKPNKPIKPIKPIDPIKK